MIEYTEKEVIDAALTYYKGDTLAADVWAKKYALKNDGKWYEKNPSETVTRVINEIIRMENNYPNPTSDEKIKYHLDNFQHFIPGGSILFGLGNNFTVSSLGNCFFIDNGADSYGGIFNLDESMVQLMKRRGGVGITIENLRPAAAKVNNAAATSTGSVSFMHRFSSSTREVAQDGRRGALMISEHVAHPDIKDFVMAKDDLTKVTGANVSVKITDEFMKSVESDGDYILRWPVESKQPIINEQFMYNKLYKREDGSYIRRVKAREVWELIIKQAHKNAEPGVLFWDNIIKESPADCYSEFGFTTKGTNPCGEVPLSPYDSCRLGSIVLSAMVKDPYTDKAKVNYKLLEEVSRFAQRFMDDIVSLEEEKIKVIIAKIENDPEDIELKRTELGVWEKVLDVLLKGRRTGIGVLGLGDMLAMLGIQYGSKEATKIIDKIFETIAVSCMRETVQLAEERGCFPVWNADLEAQNPFIIRTISNHFNTAEYKQYLNSGRRNIAMLSIAPTGSLAIWLQVTSGIEPVFKCYYKRRRKINPNEIGVKVDHKDENGDCWQEYAVFHPEFEKWLKTQDIQTDITTLEDAELNAWVAKSPWSGAESHDIDYIEKVNMQGVVQKWIDHSISITHNLPTDVTVEEVAKIYMAAWKAGCKGCTIYREGSRTGVLITNSSKEKEDEFKQSNAPRRPKELKADYYVASANGTKFAVIVGLWKDTNKPYEIFAFENPPMDKNTKGRIVKIKKGHYKFINGEFEIDGIQLAANKIEERAHTILLSMLLRHGAPIEHINNVAKKIDENITSFSSVCRRVLSKYMTEEHLEESCPECGGHLIREEGCIHCDSCSYSKC